MNAIALGPARSEPTSVELLRRTLDDATLELVYRQSANGVWIDELGLRVPQSILESGRAVTPLERDGDWVAAVVHDPGLGVDSIQAACTEVVALIDDERLKAELRAQLRDERISRARILAASDRQRRRFERNLHDGAQQRLVGLALTLQLAGRRAGDGRPVTELLEESVAELEQAIRDLHELARGLHPAIVNDAGLGEALATLAERPGIPVRLDLELPDRLPDSVAVGGYYLVAEALTNANKHSGASTITVGAHVADGALHISIADDGRGGAAVSGAGSGLLGLADRAAALGGQLSVDSTADRGTTVKGTIPLDARVSHLADDILLRVAAADGSGRPYGDGTGRDTPSVRDDHDRRRRALKWMVWQNHAGPGEIVDAQPDTEDIRYAKSLLLLLGGNHTVPAAVRDWVLGYLTANGYSEDVLDEARRYDDTETIVELMGSPRMSIAARPLVYDGLRACAFAGYRFSPEDFDAVLRGAEALGVPRDVVADLQEIVIAEARLRERRHEIVVAPAMPKLLNDSIVAARESGAD